MCNSTQEVECKVVDFNIHLFSHRIWAKVPSVETKDLDISLEGLGLLKIYKLLVLSSTDTR